MLKSQKDKFEEITEDVTCYEEWLEKAESYDRDTGMARWRKIDESKEYDFQLVRNSLEKLRGMRKRKNNSGLLFVLNEGIHGNLGGMGSEELYNRSKAGTKKLISDYIYEVSDALEYIASPEVKDISFETKLDFFFRAQECFGNSALMLSGSGSLLYFHIGVVLALAEQDLLPKIVSGSSGGAFIGSMLCTHTNEDLARVFDIDYFTHSQYEEPEKGKGVLADLKTPVASIDQFRIAVERLIPDMTFEDARLKTGRHLNISVASAENSKNSRLLNAKTSPNVFLRDSILASAAAPGLFPPTGLKARNDKGKKQAYLPSSLWVDGSLSADLPTKRLARLYGVNHFIVSQTNPHVIPFVTDAKRKRDAMSLIKDASFDTARTWLNTSASLWKKPMSSNEQVSKLTHTLLSIINQNYKGDINIMPPKKFFNIAKQFGAKSKPEMIELIEAGKRATWPKIEMIRVQSKISRTLETITSQYHEQIVQEHKSLQRIKTKR